MPILPPGLSEHSTFTNRTIAGVVRVKRSTSVAALSAGAGTLAGPRVPRPTLLFTIPRLREYRIAKRWTQAQLATRAGLGRPSISRLEGAGGTARWETVEKLARVFDVPPEELGQLSQPD
jgi:DNA-binding XRE family transcriptional regulator